MTGNEGGERRSRSAVKAFSCTPHRGVESEDQRGGRRGLSQRSFERGKNFNVKKVRAVT